MSQLEELLEHVSAPAITLTIPREDFLAAQALAVESGCTVHELVLEALNTFLYDDEVDDADDESDEEEDDAEEGEAEDGPES